MTFTIFKAKGGKKVRTFRHRAKKGMNRVHLNARRLRLGRYRLTVSVRKGNHLSATFTVTRPRHRRKKR